MNLFQRTSTSISRTLMMRPVWTVILFLLALPSCPVYSQGACNRACYPQSVNLIDDNSFRSVTTDSTCGSPPSEFDIPVASNTGDTFMTILCNASNPDASYPIEAAYDFTSMTFFGQVFTSPLLDTWWQSESEASNVHLDFTLGNEFLFQRTVISFRSYRPASLVIEKTADGGANWSPLRYYAGNCAETFPGVPLISTGFNFTADCTQEYVFGHGMTEADGENIQRVIYNPVQELEELYSEYEYQRYFALTGLRITLVEPGNLESVSQESLPRRSFFAVADWIVEGQCLCYGHSASCVGMNEAECSCQHNTAGPNCDSCLPLYNNKPWQVAVGSETNACEDCGCSGRAQSCVYDEVKGYGVCLDCQENTSGDKCEVCLADYYRNPYTDPTFNDTCIACNCTVEGTVPNSVCNKTNGQCACKANVQGRACDECKDTFYNLQDSNDRGCQECDCDSVGTIGNINLCNKTTGECICKDNVMGTRCDQCQTGTFNLDPSNPKGCTSCDCDPGAAISGSCDPDTGACTCRPNVIGRACNDTAPGFYVPRLDGINMEGEVAATDQPSGIEERLLGEGALHTGPGFLVVSPSTVITMSSMTVPQTQNYVLAIRYETLSNWSDVTIEINQQNPTMFDCQGSSNPGTSSTPVSLPAAEYGGVYYLSEECLAGGIPYDVIIRLGIPDTQEQFLLDSIVLLPVLSDLEVYQLNRTSQSLRADMDACWSAALSAQHPTRMNCSDIEFGIMAEVFDGAIGCDCSSLGSDSNPVCESYGGQCPCLPGVTSRSCDTCSPFYYGIESGNGCTDCGCNLEGSITQSCNQTSGICECKLNVEGDKCDTCATDHYGLSTGTGCEQCSCTPEYSLGTSCNDDGQCSCKTGVGGLRCDQCAPEFFNLTTDGCSECGCNTIGSVDGNCNSQGQCNCLPSATGLHCDECPSGTYGFGPYSERGCIECLCSSHTTNCTSATDWFLNRVESQYSLLNFEGAVSDRWTGITGDGDEVAIVSEPILEITDPRFVLQLVDPGNTDDLFFLSPYPYLGDHRTAYGQQLEIKLSQTTSENQTRSTEGDVYIFGGCGGCEPLVASLPYVPGSPVTNATSYQFKLHENYWNLGNISGARPTMQQVMRILADISEIRIRAKYTTLPGQSVYFHDSSLTEASNNLTAASSDVTVDYVEDCFCPPEYTGQFCEQCAAGYRRATPGDGSFSTCVPCDCNGHSDLPCDPETGVCRGCQDNTGGDFCEHCLDGYYGNALGGTPGDCSPCQCPGVPGANSFAATCDANGLCIDCAEGHGGNFCEYCLEGYYGVPSNPENNGGRCQPCYCNLSPAVCDSTTGQCQNCTGNTEGQECEVCRFGYWGNIDSCQECTCNLTGGHGNCTQDTGTCYCYPNVIGSECTECAPDTWGFASGAGCLDCECHPVGTVDQQTQCNLVTGQCNCKSLVTGQKCDGCMMGYYDVDQECIACNCNINGTNPVTCSNDLCGCDLDTGQCDCKLATIAGRTCDRCGRLDQDEVQVVEEIFVGNFPNCEPCPECFQNWREELEILGELLVEERKRLLGLLRNYGNMTETDVKALVHAIQGNLTLADQVIEQGNQQTQNLIGIQNSFLMITESIENKTSLLDSLASLENNITFLLSESSNFDGTVEVEMGVQRNSERLNQELLAVTNTIENIVTEAEGIWESVQTLYQAILEFQDRARQLIAEVDSLLFDVEGASQQRLTVEDILSEPTRTAEMEVNSQRLGLIDSTQARYPLEEAAQNASAAQRLVQEANQTATGAYQQAQSERTMSEERAYRSEVARFNATGATLAAANALSVARNYKDVALETKANITQAYVDTLNQLSQLDDAQVRSQEASAASQATVNMAVRSPTDMEALVRDINATGLSDAAVLPLLENSTTTLDEATASLETARRSLQDAISVKSQIDTIEYDISEAERVREVTGQRVIDTQNMVTNISQIAAEVQAQSESKNSDAQATSALLQDLSTEAADGQQCFSAKRAQVQDAGRRIDRVKQNVEVTQQELNLVLSSAEETAKEINDSKNEAVLNHNLVQEVDAAAASLERDLIGIEEMINLDDLIAQYTTQRQEMEQLSSDLDSMETTLDTILANLQGISTDDIQCND
nr:laminin subunit beta-1-like [Lytechinus pictus]